MKFIRLLYFMLCLSNLSFSMNVIELDASRKFIVITDLEPDDRIALHILAARISQDNILFVGTTVMNAAKKQVLTKRLLDQLGLKRIPVYQGTGGTASSYEDISSSRAAREYEHEGMNILAQEELEELNKMPHSSLKLQNQIKNALNENEAIEFILLAPPTDLVQVLNSHPKLRKNIKHIYIMGGWIETKLSDDTILRSTYNWNMDPISSKQLLEIKDIPMTIYSSHTIKKFFEGGSINSQNFPEIINMINKCKSKLPSLIDQEAASLSWDKHIIEKIPFFSKIIEPYKGQQFTPADPLLMIGIINKSLIRQIIPIDICMDVNDKDMDRGFRVYVSSVPSSNINLVEEIDCGIFEEELLKSFELLASSNLKH